MPDFNPVGAEQQLAAGFAARIRKWSLERGANPRVANATAHAAAQLSLACSAGDVCIELNAIPGSPDWPDDLAAQSELLLASQMVATPADARSLPLVLDTGAQDTVHLYLHRYFDYEHRLAKRVLALHQNTLPIAQNLPELRASLDALFADAQSQPESGPDWQRIAVAMALASRLTVVSGGPGTGKTTMVVNLLACLLQADPKLRVALAAPTGKAAARMTDAIRRRARHLPDALATRLPQEAFTIHRLLGVGSGAQRFRHGEQAPLACDLLVIDEASMLDLSLAVHLFEALPDNARIVLLGDKDQLAAVESGSVFADLSANPSLSDPMRQTLSGLTGLSASAIQAPVSAPNQQALLADSVVWFSRNYRFAADSGIGRLAACINQGDPSGVLASLGEPGDAGLRWLSDARQAQALLMADAMGGYESFLAALDCEKPDPSSVFAAFDRFRVLCALRDGPWGVDAVNAQISAQVRQRLQSTVGVSSGGPSSGRGGASGFSPWYVGRPVMVLRNDYVLKLFNGDIGITLLSSDGELMVYFAQTDGQFRAIAPVRLPAVETAFAMTVHKSQGSEFDRVLVVLGHTPNRVMSRELLYTAVTRAREQVAVLASSEVLQSSVARKTQRRSGFSRRLHELHAG